MYNATRFCPGRMSARAVACNPSFPDDRRWMMESRGPCGEVNAWSKTCDMQLWKAAASSTKPSKVR